MADGVSIKVTGLPEFKSRLQALGADMEKKIVRSGALAAGVIFKKAAIANAPVLKKPDTRKKYPRVAGTLKKAIYAVRSRSKSQPGKEVIVVAARSGGKGAKTSKNAFYWKWVEAGHLARGPGQKLKGGKNRVALERKRLTASGAKFVPGAFFLKRAFDSSGDAALKAFSSRIESRIEKANKELNNK
jgi:HK97 gp10 family phage protein